jgi:hypothetical protein
MKTIGKVGEFVARMLIVAGILFAAFCLGELVARALCLM